MESPSSFLARSWSRAVAWASPSGKRKLEVQRDKEEEDRFTCRRANKRARYTRTRAEEQDGPEQAWRHQRTEEQSSLEPPGTPTSKPAAGLVDHLLTPVKHLVPHGRAFVTALFSVYGDSGGSSSNTAARTAGQEVEDRASAESEAAPVVSPPPLPSPRPASSASLVKSSSAVAAPPSPASSTSPSSPPDTDSSLYTYIDLTTGDDEDEASVDSSSSASFNYSALPPPDDDEEEEEEEVEGSSAAETTRRLEEERALADQEWRQGPLLAALRDAFAPRGAAPRPRAPDLLFDLRRMEESQMFRETLTAGPRGEPREHNLERASTPRRDRRERRGPSTSTSTSRTTSFSSPSTSILDAIVEAKRLRSPPPASSRRARARRDEPEEADEPSLTELTEADTEFGAYDMSSRLQQAELGRQFWTAMAKCESRKRAYDHNRSTWTEAIDKSQAALEQTQSAFEVALIELRAEEQRRRLEKARAKWLAEDRRAFSAEEQALVKRLLKGNPSEVLVRGFNAELTRSDLQRLRDTEWLNDEVINFYLNLLQKRSNNNAANPAQAEWPKVHFLNTFFYPLLSDKGGYNYARVQKWTRRVDLLAMHRVVIPIHLGNHWCLAVINIQNKRFEYYDSLGGSNRECLQRLRRYLQDEARDKKKTELDLSTWPDYQPKDIPQQKNGYDCGVFACKFAECVASGRPFYFSQVDMPIYRKRMLLSIYHQSLSS